MICKHLNQVPENSKIFLAEGLSEAHFFQKILDNVGDTNSLVFCFEGLGKFGTVLKNLAGVPGFSKLKLLCVMLDAELDFNARADSVIALFGGHGVTINRSDLVNSNPISTGLCPMGIYISPGGGLPGRIEDLVLGEVRGSNLISCLDQYSNCVSQVISHPLDAKSLVQTYISTRVGSLCGVGRAFQANVLDVNHSSYDVPRSLFVGLIAQSNIP